MLWMASQMAMASGWCFMQGPRGDSGALTVARRGSPG